jgi:hypothetical protein
MVLASRTRGSVKEGRLGRLDTLFLPGPYCDLMSGKQLYLKIIWNYPHFSPLLLFT